MDENAWVDVVRDVFALAFWLSRDGHEEEDLDQYERQDFSLISMYVDLRVYLHIAKLTTRQPNADHRQRIRHNTHASFILQQKSRLCPDV